jgi:putative oxidoreductase
MLILAGIGSSLIALLHLLIIIIGEEAYRLFHGVGDEFADLLLSGSAWPTIITAILTLLFSIFAAYAFSGSGIIIALPKVRAIIILIGSIYILRGLINIPFYINIILKLYKFTEYRSIVFDTISLTMGLLYIIGLLHIINAENKS